MALSYYSTVEAGDAYFQEQLDCSDWFAATPAKKLTALKQATQIVDSLPLIGEKLVADQTLEFPRDYQSAIPDQVLWAVYEISKRLLAGVDVETLVSRNLVKEKFGPVEREFRQYQEENAYLYLGIPSQKAYRLLLPYLRQPSTERVRV